MATEFAQHPELIGSSRLTGGLITMEVSEPSKEMNRQYLLLVSLLILTGCDSNEEQVVPRPFADFDAAVEAIATSQDLELANTAAFQLYSGGTAAIDALRKHLHDKREIPSGFCTRTLSSYDGLTMAEQAFWSIQDMIETGLPKMYGDTYSVLNRENVEQWLDYRQGKSITELQFEAARDSHKRAEKAGDHDAAEIFRTRLRELANSQ